MSNKQKSNDDDHDCDLEEGAVCNTTKTSSSSETVALGTQFSKFYECPSSLLSVTSKTTLQLLETACLLICDSFPPKVDGSDDDEENPTENSFFFDICGGDVAPTSQQIEYSYDLELRT